VTAPWAARTARQQEPCALRRGRALLACSGGDELRHRAPSIPALIIAATAELAGLTVLHMDKDFEIIAAITGQPLERLNIA